jgi:hypothetical protein
VTLEPLRSEPLRFEVMTARDLCALPDPPTSEELTGGGCDKPAAYAVGNEELGWYLACADCAEFWAPQCRRRL